jgi:multidrug efflux pump subunit AcrA (membrane-fusion protein)
MASVPKQRLDRVEFYESHLSPWNANAAAIGLLPADLSDLQTKTAAARAAYNAQQAALQAAKAATEAYYNSVTSMGVAGDLAMFKIKNKAISTANPNVYALAQIPAPASRRPSGNPTTPSDFEVSIDNTGALQIQWKNSEGRHCIYNIYRKLASQASFEFLLGVGKKTFTDNTVPAGSGQVQYQIQAVRSTGVSDWGLFVVNLGVTSNGIPSASVSEMPARQAA